MTHDQIIAVEKFANGLLEVFGERLHKVMDAKDIIDEHEKSILGYVIKIIAIHKDLAELEFDKEADKQAEGH